MRIKDFFNASKTHLLVATLSAFVLAIVAVPAFAQGGTRNYRVVNVNATPGTQVAVSVELDSLGNEAAASFSLNFDQTKLSNPTITLGTGAPAGLALTINPNQAGSGRLGILVDSSNTFALGVRQVVSVRFDVAAGAPGGPTVIDFGGTPIPRSTSDALANLLDATYEAGAVNIASAAAADNEISGTVFTTNGTSGLRNATVVLTSSTGVRRRVLTSSFGSYSFSNVAGGQNYTITVNSRRFRFAARQVTIDGNLSGLDFLALE